MKVLVFGGTGFVGSHLVSKLVEEYEVTVVTRDPKKIDDSEDCLVGVIEGDLLNHESLNFLDEFEIIYYLVHAMDQAGDYLELEKVQAMNLASQLSEKHKVIYLSGLAQSKELSKHMRSRHQVGKILKESKACVIEFRASIVIGGGSLSFELVRAIVERFPVILEADWARSKCCPIFIDDLVQYLSRAMTLNETQMIEIGGSEEVEYVDLLKTYAKVIEVKRAVLKIPQFPIGVVANVMDIFLPEFSQVGKNLLESITLDSVVRSTDYQQFDITPRSIEYAMKKCIEFTDESWDELTVEELFSNAKFSQIKQNFASASLIDRYEFYVSFPKVYLTKALDSFLKLYNINPFKKFSLVDFYQTEDCYKLHLENKLIKEFQSTIHFIELEGVTKVEVVNYYRPSSFADASGYVAFNSLGSLLFETLRKFLPK
jgi:uncharacterized protein YbjT (DUF2867 family)